MSKKEKIKEIGSLLRYLGDLFESLVEDEPKGFDTASIGTEVAEAPLPTLEQVRAVLGRKSEDGFTEQVHELLKKFGAEKLSDLDEKHYKEILAKAEDLKHA